MVRNIEIGPHAVAEEAVNWNHETQKKQKLQRTMMGLTALLGGFVLIGRCQELFKIQPAQVVGLMAFWLMLIVRVLWSFVWFPSSPVAGTPDTDSTVESTNPAASGAKTRTDLTLF